MKKLLFTAVLLSGCLTNDEIRQANVKGAINTIAYIKDSRTNLCFATWNPGWMGQSYVSVPCTPEVEALIEK